MTSSQSQNSPRSKPAAVFFSAWDRPWLLPGVFLVLPLLWVVAYFFPPLNQDVAVILSVAERWMDGERLYRDMIDVNPPLIFMLTLIPVALAKVLPIDTPSALMMCVLALSVWSIWASYRLMAALAVAETNSLQLFLLPLLIFNLIVFPSEMFGQREHLMACGMIPYLLLAALRCDDKKVSVAFALTIAVIAAIGFSLKPHFLMIVLAVEVYLLCKRSLRSTMLDLVPWVVIVTMAAYVVFACYMTPDYFSFVLPLVLRDYEAISGISYFSITTSKHLGPYLFVAIPLTITAFGRRWPHVTRLTGIVTLAAALAGVSQDKGWPYHLLPAQMGSILLFGWAVARMTDRLQHGSDVVMKASRSMIGLMLLMIYGLAGAVRFGLYDQMDYEYSQAGQWQRILERHAGGTPVLMLTPGIYPHFPAMNYAKLKEVSRFLTIWPLQSAYDSCKPEDPRYHTPEQMTPAERLYNRMLIEDFVKNKPQLVVIDRIPGIPWCGGREFSFLEYFLMQPDFATEWQNYEYTAVYDRYFLYKRKSGSTG